MSRVLQPYFLRLATAADRELAHMDEYFEAENRVLPSRLPKRVIVTQAERLRLVSAGARLEPTARDLALVTSLSYLTVVSI